MLTAASASSMNTSPIQPMTPADLLKLLSKNRWLLIVPMIAGAVLAVGWSFVNSRDWRADQGLLIRSDAAGYSDQRLGKFTDLSEMKTVQETLLELARSKSVVTAVLNEVGVSPNQINAEAVEKFRKKLRFTPPGGAEFGKTEVFYLGILDPKPSMAIAKVESLTRQLTHRLQELRDQRAASMVAEVERSVNLAEIQIQAHVKALSNFEQSVGADLIELRHLVSNSGGQSDLGQRTLSIQSEERAARRELQQNIALLNELTAAKDDPGRLLSTPDTLLSGQPALRRLKEGLIDAQLGVARLSGVRTSDHPYVKAARETQERVHTELSRELPTVMAGINFEIDFAKQQQASRNAELKQIKERIAKLGSRRAKYKNLTSNVEGQTEVLDGALQQLADAESHRAGVNSASLLSPLDSAELSVYPIGPSRATIMAAGGVAGLILGFVLLFISGAPKFDPTFGSIPTAASQKAPSNEANPFAAWASETAGMETKKEDKSFTGAWLATSENFASDSFVSGT